MNIAARLKRHYLPLLLLSLISSLIFYLLWKKRDAITFTADATGYISLALLSVTMITGTLNLFVGKTNPVSSYFRRDLGIVAGILALIHSVTGLFVHLRGNMWQYFFFKTEKGLTMRFDDFGWANYTGLVAAVLVVLLIITSNDWSIRKLNPVKWKNFQRLTYPMFVIVLIHAVYYRIIGNNLDRVWYLYLPLLGLILAFQLVGIQLKMGQNMAKL